MAARHRNQGRRERPPEPSLEHLWPNYLHSGYFDRDGTPNADYVCRDRIEPLIKAMSQARPSLTSHQVRRFFQHCRVIESRLKANRTTWEQEIPNFKKLDIAAADAFGKTNKKIPKLFHDFVRVNVAAVKSEKDFLEGFLRHFEALVGFGQQFLQERERN